MPISTDRQVEVAIVTGAASGLGRAMALDLRIAGIEVTGVDRNDGGLAAVAETARERQTTGALHAVGADLTEPEAFHRIVANVQERSGRIDGSSIMPVSASRPYRPISAAT